MAYEQGRAGRWRLRHGTLSLAVGACLPFVASAQSLRIEPAIEATITASDNSRVSSEPNPAKDVIVDVAPSVLVRSRGASFTLDGTLSANFLIYTNKSQDNRFLPRGNLTLNATLVDRWVYFDAGALAEQVLADPFAPRGANDRSLDKINSLRYRISPYIQHYFTPSLSLLARNDNIWTRRRGDFAAADTRRDSSFRRNSLVVEQRPLPFGYSVELGQETTSFFGGVETVLNIDSARAVASYAFDPTFNMGLIAGTEKTEYALLTSTDQIGGVRIQWFPTERTELKASVEKRYFGTGGTLQWSHRSPFIGMFVSASREPAAIGTSFVFNPDGGDVRLLLDNIFRTRYPNDADRAVVVGNVLSSLGVPGGFSQPIEVFSDYAQLRQLINASIVFQGLNTTLVTRGFVSRARRLPSESVSILPPTLSLDAENDQRGLGVDLTRRFSPTGSVEFSISYSEIIGAGALQGQSTESTRGSVTVIKAVGPKTRMTAGLRHVYATSTGLAAIPVTARENAAFVGMSHRF